MASKSFQTTLYHGIEIWRTFNSKKCLKQIILTCVGLLPCLRVRTGHKTFNSWIYAVYYNCRFQDHCGCYKSRCSQNFQLLLIVIFSYHAVFPHIYYYCYLCHYSNWKKVAPGASKKFKKYNYNSVFNKITPYEYTAPS